MNNAGLPPVEVDPVQRARDLGPVIDAAVVEIEKRQDFPEPLASLIHETKLWRLLLPRSVGGLQVPPWVYMAAVEEVARHDGSVGWNMFVGNSAALIAPFIPLESAQQIFGDPRAGIAWGPPSSIRAKAVPGGFHIAKSESHFCSGYRQATWCGVHCLVEEPDGSVRLNRFGRPSVRTLLFPKKHTTPIHDWNTIGMRGTASEGFTVTDLFVPAAMDGTREDPGLRRDRGRLYAFTTQNLYAVGVAAVALGIAGAMLDAFAKLATEKTPRNLGRLADLATVQSDTAKRIAHLGAARAYLVDVLKEVWDGADEIEPIGAQERARVRLACSHAIQTASDTADWSYKAAGTSAIFPGTPFERRFRDIHTLTQQIQSRDAHFETVGRVLLNGDPDGTFLG